LWGDDILPVVAFIDGVVQALPFCLAFEATNPDAEFLLFLANEAADDHHTSGNLGWNEFFFHEFYPLLPLSRSRAILPQFEEHQGLLSSRLFPNGGWNVWPGCLPIHSRKSAAR
jgi:hypothetical protein